MGYEFEWGAAKELSNRRKRGGAFDEATTVVADALSLSMPDPRHAVEEERFLEET